MAQQPAQLPNYVRLATLALLHLVSARADASCSCSGITPCNHHGICERRVKVGTQGLGKGTTRMNEGPLMSLSLSPVSSNTSLVGVVLARE